LEPKIETEDSILFAELDEINEVIFIGIVRWGGGLGGEWVKDLR
jgi:hypothetical protein